VNPAVIKIGHVKGSGRFLSKTAEEFSEDFHYTTDGLRVVMVFGDRPEFLSDIDYLN